MITLSPPPQTWFQRNGFDHTDPVAWMLLAVALLSILAVILWIRERRYFSRNQRENQHRGFQVIASYRKRS